MPIVLPTRTELARMGWRQRDILAKNLSSILTDISEVCADLTGTPAPKLRHAKVGRPRCEEKPFNVEQLLADARILAARLGADPDAQAHRDQLDTRYRTRQAS